LLKVAPAKPLRVLYVNPFSQQVSGPDESLRALIRELTPLGLEPHLVLPRPGPQVPRYEALGVTVHYAPLSILQRRVSPLDLALFGARTLRGARALAGLARRIEADLIHTNMEVVLDGGLAARWLGLPHVMHYRGNTLDRPRPVFDLLTRAWTALADRIFCISHATAAIFRSRRRDAKVSVLYNPVDITAFSGASRSAEVRAALGVAGDAPLVGTVGRIHPRKDLDTFIQAAALVAARHPRARFAIIGAAEGPAEEAYRQTLQQLAATLGLGDRLVFAGARLDMPAIFKALDVFVLSSRHEGFGRVVAEAMAAGVAGVVTREGALPELLQDGVHGFTAAPATPPEFARGIARLIDDPALRSALGGAARLRAQAFDSVAVGGEVMATYRRLCG
jgi:glycosyltransferase involved in cell wall biosynthesis